MSTSKIVLCVLSAAAAGLLVSTLATNKGVAILESLRNGVSDLFEKKKSSNELQGGRDQRAEFDQANNAPGIA